MPRKRKPLIDAKRLARSALLVGGPFDGEVIDDPYRVLVHLYDKAADMFHGYEREVPGRYVYRGAQRGGLCLPTTASDQLCEDCPPVGYPTDKTRCTECPRRPPNK
jgi:hypothetical protein